MHFVGQRFPAIQSISLSAVQPHGRATHNLQLLPDYEQLGKLVPDAIKAASQYGIKVLNPYCGLPVCVGWRGQYWHQCRGD